MKYEYHWHLAINLFKNIIIIESHLFYIFFVLVYSFITCELLNPNLEILISSLKIFLL